MADKTRLPRHIGIIPDGNRRWADKHSMERQEGYSRGVEPGFALYELMLASGIKEATFYGFTKDNNKRPPVQREAFTQACINAVRTLSGKDANLLVIGNTKSVAFPKELLEFAGKRVNFGKGLIDVNFLVNYDWNWDLQTGGGDMKKIASQDISRIDLIIRWGGRRRLSGFLPVQSVYADFYIVDEYWPDFTREHFDAALEWYKDCDVTLGG